jgi:signal transduction histidine kinase
MTEQAHVLIVDDEPGVRESLRAILLGECIVHTAASGAEALDQVARLPIDVVTLDLRMPGLGGIGVLERIKAHDPDIEALIISGYNSFDSAVDGMRLRAFDYVSKPFDIEHVRDLVRRAVERRRAVRRLRSVEHDLFANLNDTFRTPLNVILGYSEMLREQSYGDLAADQRSALDRICSNSASLVRYLDGIFLLAELASGNRPVAHDHVLVADLFHQVHDAHVRAATEKGLHFRIQSTPDLAVEADQGLLLTLITELVENAIRFTERGGVSLSATPEPEHASVTIIVRDTGAGIGTEHLVAASPAGADGSGRLRMQPSGITIGLHTVAAIARHLEAPLDVVTSRDQGSEFRLTLPACVPATRPAPSLSERIST